jgi:GR25 family glycosyltransferase involved in LPS biosynthesis
MLNINVIHYTKLKDRKNNILNIFKDKDVNLNFIEEYDAEQINKENIKKFYNPDQHEFFEKLKLWNYTGDFRYLTLGEISVAIKQITAIHHISNSKSDYELIIEDDIIPFTENFLDDINNSILQIPSDWDAIFIGNGCGENFIQYKLIDAEKINEFVFKPKHPATNCAEAFLLKKHSAKKIYDSILPFQLAFDWELAYHFFKLKMNVYWIHPSIFYQGSISGAYPSSLRK